MPGKRRCREEECAADPFEASAVAAAPMMTPVAAQAAEEPLGAPADAHVATEATKTAQLDRRVTEVETMFGARAQTLLNGSLLKVGISAKLYRICEIEFYYCAPESDNPDTHRDLYTHCDDLQLEYGKFYPHRTNGKGFKGGTFKCMDITYGDRAKKIYFGVLIRSIKDMLTGEFFTGPCLCVNELLRHYGVKEWKELASTDVMKQGEDVVSFINRELTLVSAEVPEASIFVGPRVGLSDKYPAYQTREYRYAIDIKSIKKQKIFRPLAK